MSHSGWIGVDLDGTLAYYEDFISPTHIGEPVPEMLERVKGWLAEGREVRILTARVFSPPHDARRIQEAANARQAITVWCIEHLGAALPVTCVKDYSMWKLYDDRAVRMEKNTGRLMSEDIE